jgi:phosphoglycerate dehydrogenase-like enzyme
MGVDVSVKVVSLSHIFREELRPLIDAAIDFVAVDPDDDAAAAAAIYDADVIISTKFDAAMAVRAKKLRLLLCPSAGTEGIERDQLPPGVVVRNGEGHEIPMAEYVIGVLVALRQRLLPADKALRDGRWEYGFLGPGGFIGELFGSRLGLIGFGRIGRAIVPRAAAFGMTTLAVTMHPEKVTEPVPGLESVGDLKSSGDVDALCSGSDAIVLCCELSGQSRGLLDARRLKLMAKHAVVVNIARGPIADEQAFYEALRDRRRRGGRLVRISRRARTTNAAVSLSLRRAR